MMDAIFGWRRYLIGGAVILALLATSHACTYAKGRQDGAGAEKRAEAQRLERARKLVLRREAKAEKITQSIKAETEAAQVQIRYRTVKLIEKVTEYVPVESDARCTVPVGFVRLHNDAASGGEAVVPKPPGGPVEAPSGVPLSEVLGTTVGNYGVAYEWRAEALAWREWYGAQKAAWAKR